jgi:hypothetical protein
MHPELLRINDVQRIRGFAKISEVSFRAQYVETKDRSDIKECVKGTRGRVITRTTSD